MRQENGKCQSWKRRKAEISETHRARVRPSAHFVVASALRAYCVSDGGEKGRAGSPLPAAARTKCAPCHPGLTPYLRADFSVAPGNFIFQAQLARCHFDDL